MINDNNSIRVFSNVLLFDGTCMFCSSCINFILKNEEVPTMSFCTINSKAGEQIFRDFGIDKKQTNSLIYIEENKVNIKSKAVFKIASHLRKPYKFIQFFRYLPVVVTDSGYKLVAKYRHSFYRKRLNCYVYPENFKSRFLDYT